ncbi:unnamed protein product, partial [Gulo gulo]
KLGTETQTRVQLLTPRLIKASGLWPSPVQDPDLVGAGQGRTELVGFVYQCGISELLPHEVPLLLTALGDGV